MIIFGKNYYFWSNLNLSNRQGERIFKGKRLYSAKNKRTVQDKVIQYIYSCYLFSPLFVKTLYVTKIRNYKLEIQSRSTVKLQISGIINAEVNIQFFILWTSWPIVMNNISFIEIRNYFLGFRVNNVPWKCLHSQERSPSKFSLQYEYIVK